MEPKANELSKGLALGRDENIHIRITPLGDVGSHNSHASIIIPTTKIKFTRQHPFLYLAYRVQLQ